MYGTVALMKAKPGKLNQIVALQDDWNATRKPQGYVGEQVYRLDRDANEFMLVVLFEDKQSYLANAQDPEQDREYQRLRALLDADPVWHDGEVIHTFHV